MASNIDRRKNERASLHVMVEFEIHDTINHYTKKYKTKSINISGNGILINAVHLPAKALAHLIQQESSLDLEIFLSLSSHPIKAKGKVVWITKDSKETGDYGVAVKFVSIDKKDKMALVKHLNSEQCFS